MGLREGSIRFCRQNCIAHPFRKRTCCCANESLALCCDVAMLLTGQKLLDDLHDEGFAKRLAVRLVLPFARRDYKKARGPSASACPAAGSADAAAKGAGRKPVRAGGCGRRADRPADGSRCSPR